MALGLSACQVNSPVTTDLDYAASDGINMQVGEVSVDGLAIVSAGSGAAGILTGAAVNAGDEAVTIQLAMDTESGPVAIDPALEVSTESLLRLDDASDDYARAVAIDSVESTPGTLVTIQAETADGEVGQARVPILLPEGPYAAYAEELNYTPEESEEDHSGGDH